MSRALPSLLGDRTEEARQALLIGGIESNQRQLREIDRERTRDLMRLLAEPEFSARVERGRDYRTAERRTAA